MLASFVGTAGDDVFDLFDVGSGMQIVLNGTTIGSSSDSTVSVDALGGNDRIRVLVTFALSSVDILKLQTGAGNDTIEAGSGNFGTDIGNTIEIQDSAGSAQLILHDDNSTGSHPDVHFDLNGLTAGTADIVYRHFSVLQVSSVELQCSSASDDVFIDSDDAPSTRIFTGNGTNTVHFGGTVHAFDTFVGGHVFGGTGVDTVVFDDSGDSSSGDPQYSITPTSVLNQVMQDVERVELKVSTTAVSTTNVSGGGGASEYVRIRGTFSHLAVQADLDDQAGKIIADFTIGTLITIVDTDDDNSSTPISLYRAEAGASQYFQKGNFVIAGPLVTGLDDRFRFTGSNSADVIEISGIKPGLGVTLNGGGGNDIVRTGNINGSIHDLDGVFIGESRPMIVQGGPGIDSIELDDSADQIGDQDEYQITTGSIRKHDFASGTATFAMQPQEVEKLLLKMDDDPNRIDYDLSEYTHAELFGGAGADQFFNKDSNTVAPNRLDLSLAAQVTLHGDAGADEVIFDDTNGTGDSFDISASLFIFGNLPDIRVAIFDGFSAVYVNGNSGVNHVNVGARPTGATLLVDSGAGADTFTVGAGDLDSSGLLTATGVTLNGGTGIDQITFDDQFDLQTDGATSDYTIDTFALAKGTASLGFSTFESVTLVAANGVIANQLNTIPVVNFNAINGFADSVTILGGSSRGCIVNVGNGTLGSIPLLTNFVSCTSLTLNDNAFTSTSNWVITPTAITRTTSGQTLNYQAGSVVINTGSGNDTIGVNSLGAGVSLAVNAGNGADRFTLGSGDVDANLPGPVALNGGAGNNVLIIDNSADNSVESQSLNATSFVDGLTYSFSGITSRTYNAGSGGTTLSITNGTIPQTINGGAGNDTFHLFGGSLITQFTSSFVLNGNGGVDTMNLLGQADGTSSRYDFPTSTQFRFGDVNTGPIITYSGIENASLQTSSAGDTVNVTSIPFALRISTGTGNDVIAISNFSGTVSTLPITVNTGPENTSFGGGDDLTVSGATVVIEESDAIRNLSVSGTVRVTNNAVLTRVPPLFDFLPLNLTGVIDLSNGALLWRSGGQTPDFRAMLASGRNNGQWNGTSASGAINSSAASGSSAGDSVGYGLGSEIAITTIGGFAVNAGDTLVRHTLDGDTDLNQVVNFSDLLRVAQNYGATTRTWSQGNFNYDPSGLVDFADLLALAQQYGTSLFSAGSTRDGGTGLRRHSASDVLA